jgi:peroxiredoxin
LWPHERSLVKNLEDKPFALIGVNTNQYDAKKLKEAMDKEKLNWRSFADKGKITKQFNLVGTPTLYVLDHKGVIRYKWLGSPGEKAIDAAIEKLLKEAQAGSK